MKALPTILAGFLLTASISSPTSAAEPMKVVDRIVAIVDHRLILESELFEHARPALMTARAGGTLDQQSPAILRKALDEIVDEIVVSAEAKRRDLYVDDADVDRAIEAVMVQNHFQDERAFWGEAERQGYERTSYRNGIRLQLFEGKIVVNEVVEEKKRLGEVELARRRAAYRAKKPSATEDDARTAIDDEVWWSVRERVLHELRGQHFIELRL